MYRYVKVFEHKDSTHLLDRYLPPPSFTKYPSTSIEDPNPCPWLCKQICARNVIMPPKRKGRARGSGRPSGSGRGSGRGRGRGAGSAGRPKKSDTDAQEEGLSKPSKIVTLKIAFNPAAREECAPGLQAVSRPARPVLPDLGGQKVPLKPPGPSGPPAKAATKPPSSSAARPKLIIKLKAPARPINSTPQPILQMAPGPNEVLEGIPSHGVDSDLQLKKDTRSSSIDHSHPFLHSIQHPWLSWP